MLATLPIMVSQRLETEGREGVVDLEITELRTAAVEANYDWTFTRCYGDEKVTGLGENFLAPGLS